MVNVNDLAEKDQKLIGRIFLVIKNLAWEKGISHSGYRVVTNVGSDGGQEVEHLHFHLIGGKELGKKMG